MASIGSGMQAKRMELASQLWEAGIAVRCCTFIPGAQRHIEQFLCNVFVAL